jgi:hypothetical protein
MVAVLMSYSVSVEMFHAEVFLQNTTFSQSIISEKMGKCVVFCFDCDFDS